jgi:hypothetical protein
MRLPLSTAIGQESIVAKRLTDPYGPRTKWWKILNRDYSQKAGRAELFERATENPPDFSMTTERRIREGFLYGLSERSDPRLA